MLPTRDQPQKKRPTWTECEGLEKKIFQVMKNKSLQPKLLYPERLSNKMESEIRSFSDKRRLKEYVSTKPVLKGLLKGLL